MSLKYKLFNIPVTIDEVVDRVKKTGEVPEFYFVRHNVKSLPTVQLIDYEAGVRIGKTKVPLEKWTQTLNIFDILMGNGKIDFLDSDNYAQGKTERLASKLTQKGIHVLYNNIIHCPV